MRSGYMPSGDWIYEIKFDGYRALALRGGKRESYREQKGSRQKISRSKDSIVHWKQEHPHYLPG
jgi:ATP-dependent DNA ligase